MIRNDAIFITGIDPGRHHRNQFPQIFLRFIQAVLHVLMIEGELLIGLYDCVVLVLELSQRCRVPPLPASHAQAVRLRLGVFQNALGERFVGSQ